MNLPKALRGPALRRLLPPGLRPVTEASGPRALGLLPSRPRD